MTTNNNETGASTALSVRQEKLLAVRDEMAPGAKPRAIVPQNFAELIVMCQALAAADLAPKNLRGKATDMALVIMTGAEVGLPPMAALRLYTTWDGVPRLMAEGVRAIILQSPEIEYFEMATCDDNHATWIGKRRGRPEKSVTWTTARAQAADLLNKENWRKYRQDMFNARASMQLGRILAPDVVAGMVAAEEARDGDFLDAQSVEAKPVFVAPAAPQIPQQFLDRLPDTSRAATQGPPPGVPVMRVVNVPETAVRAEIDAAKAAAAAVTVTPTGTQPSEQPKRGPGRPPRDKSAERPTTPAPAATGSGGSSPASSTSSGEARPTTTASAPTPSPQPSASTSAPDAGSTSEAAPAGSSQTVDRWGQAIGDPTSVGGGAASASSEASTSGELSTASTASADDFGGEDPEDSEPTPTGDPAMVKLEEMKAFIASCKTRRQMDAAFPEWRDWTVQQRKAGDVRFEAKTGELTRLFGNLWSARKAELPE